MCPWGREHLKQEIKNKKLLLLLYQMTDMPYSINLNTSYRSVECQYAVLSSQNTPYCLEEQIRCLDCKTQYVVLSRRFDTSYPTGGYGVSAGYQEHFTSFGFVMSLNDYRGLDVPTAKLFLIPTGKLMVPAGSLWFLLVGFVVPTGLLTVSAASIIGPQTPLGLEQ
ncbi:hypothetical protein Tco_0530143 [Tanacetum coccineum]